MKCVSHQIAALFRWCCRCSFSSTKLNCLRSAASKCQWSTNGSTDRNSHTFLYSLCNLTKNDWIYMSGFLLTVVQVDANEHNIWRTSPIFHPQNIFSPLILHHVTHHHVYLPLVFFFFFSKIHSNKQKLLGRCTTRKHRYTAFLPPCYMTFLFGNAD